MDDDYYKTVLEKAFGSSDTESEEIKELNWELINEIKGLRVCTDFLSFQNQSNLLLAIQAEGWFNEASHNQAMRFGDLPVWATELADTVYEAVHMSDHSACLLPSNLLWRDPLFDQLIVNVYQPGEGICAHVDLLRFEDGIAIVSLESSCVMHFTHVENEDQVIGNESGSDLCKNKVAVYLTPGSLVLMSGEARYQWKHEINRKPGFQNWMGKDIDQTRRTSITLRKLCPNE